MSSDEDLRDHDVVEEILYNFTVRPFATNFHQASSMLEILVVMAAIAIGVIGAAKRRRRRMGKYLRGGIDENLGLSTLGAKTLISTPFDETVNERTLVSSVVASYSLAEFTPGNNDGPILVGLAHSDYTDAEIQAVIDQTLSWNEGDKVGQEVAKRLVRRIGQFPGPASVSTEAVVLNDGKPIKTKLNWILLQGQTLRLWAYNLGTSALATTSPIVTAQGHANLWPR